MWTAPRSSLHIPRTADLQRAEALHTAMADQPAALFGAMMALFRPAPPRIARTERVAPQHAPAQHTASKAPIEMQQIDPTPVLRPIKTGPKPVQADETDRIAQLLDLPAAPRHSLIDADIAETGLQAPIEPRSIPARIALQA